MPLPWRHLLLALGVVAIWGTNFAVVKPVLGVIPPLGLAALRFLLVGFPAILFIPRPVVPWRNLAAYGLLIGVGQFGCVYIAMDRYISPGLASLVVQTQVFFTIGFALFWKGEKIRSHQWVALGLAAAGLGLILRHIDAQTTPLGLVLVLFAALAWALGNLVARETPQANMLGYVVWSSLFAVPPLLAMTLVLEGPARLHSAFRSAGVSIWLGVLWQSGANSLFGYAAWGWLMARHSTATVMPFALLVPVFGMVSTSWWLQEPMPLWKICAGLLVLAGLGLNLFWRPTLRSPSRK